MLTRKRAYRKINSGPIQWIHSGHMSIGIRSAQNAALSLWIHTGHKCGGDAHPSCHLLLARRADTIALSTGGKTCRYILRKGDQDPFDEEGNQDTFDERVIMTLLMKRVLQAFLRGQSYIDNFTPPTEALAILRVRSSKLPRSFVPQQCAPGPHRAHTSHRARAHTHAFRARTRTHAFREGHSALHPCAAPHSIIAQCRTSLCRLSR